MRLKAGTQKVYLNIWDFGGQDVYDGTHALFLQRHAVYVILWMPETEEGTVHHDGLVLHNRPLSYWLEFVRSVARTEAPILIVQSQFDDATAAPNRITARLLHQTGFLFYDPELFHGEIILDQGWALEAIYAVFHREKSVRQLRQQGGRFTRENLGDWLWDEARHSIADQERFTHMMLQCGICFRIRKLSKEYEYPEVWQYAAPDHLPTLAEFEELYPSIELPDPATAAVAARLSFPFLHDGLLRSLLAHR